MDFSEVNWLNAGYPIMALAIGVFLFFVVKRTWTIGSLLIGLAHIPLALTNSVAPFRGLLDPDYVGYANGIIRATYPVEIFLFAGFMFVGALICAIMAVQNRPGLRNGFIVMFDFIVLLLFAMPIIARFFAGGFDTARVEFGEYLQFGGVQAFMFEFTVMALPFMFGIVWAWRKLHEQPTP